ncbi:hypothetical protein, partial [Pseudomonas aeruginosa]|uniref:hypothetical protein n=1 Tax=Pseudomonas aeruginosa TaxID=287 RepID=UPI002B22C129
ITFFGSIYFFGAIAGVLTIIAGNYLAGIYSFAEVNEVSKNCLLHTALLANGQLPLMLPLMLLLKGLMDTVWSRHGGNGCSSRRIECFEGISIGVADE